MNDCKGIQRPQENRTNLKYPEEKGMPEKVKARIIMDVDVPSFLCGYRVDC